MSDLHGSNLSNTTFPLPSGTTTYNGGNYEYSNLSGSTFPSGADLTNSIFTGADLTGITLASCNLTNCNFTNCNLTGANLTRADLTNCIFTGAIISNIILTNATGLGVVSGNCIGTTTSTLPNNWAIKNGYIISPGMIVYGANLNTISIDGFSGNLTGCSLIGATLSGTITGDLTGTNLTGANLTGANLTGTNLKGANLTGADLSLATFSRSSLTCVNLAGANLVGANLSSITSGPTTYTDDGYGYITGIPSNLPPGYAVVNSYLIGPKLNLTCANLTGTSILNVDFTGSTLTSANFTNTILTNISSNNIIYTTAPTFSGKSSKWSIHGTSGNAFLVGPTANLSNKTFSGTF